VTQEARNALAIAGLETEYFQIVDAETLAPLSHINGRPALAVAAARVGDIRLIDNQLLEP
jgi:pantoate--beta-alanine ligase